MILSSQEIQNHWQYFINRSQNFWLGAVDPIRLDTFRVALGFSILIYFMDWWQEAEEWLTPVGYHMSQSILPNFPVLPVLPVWGLPWFGIVLFGSLILWILGWKTRWISWAVLLCVTYVTWADVLSAYTLNKFFIISLSCLSLVPQGTYWTIEQKNEPPCSQSVWPIRILQTTILMVYFFCGWQKIFMGDWLKFSDVLWTQAGGFYRTDLAAWMLRTFPKPVWTWIQDATLAFELSAPLLFAIRKLRPVGLLWGLIFHTLIALLMYKLIYFSLSVLSFYILFLEEEMLHKIRIKSYFLLKEFAARVVPIILVFSLICMGASAKILWADDHPQNQPSSVKVDR